MSQVFVEEKVTEEVRRGGRVDERGPANIWIVTYNDQFDRDWGYR